MSSSKKTLDKKLKIHSIQMIEKRPHFPHLGAFLIYWASERGFGQYAIHIDPDGSIKVDSECDGKEAVKQALCKIIDDAELVD